MNKLEKHLLHSVVGEVEPNLAVRSRTRIDTGRWWWPTRSWLCVMPDELVMLTVSRRRYLERVPLSDCADTYYCHATGSLVIEPVEGLKCNRFKMAPLQALEVLKMVKPESGH